MRLPRAALFLAAAAVVMALGAGLGVYVLRPAMERSLGPEAAVGGGFTLTDHAGRAVRTEDFRGRAMLVFFGYTHCPDVCPAGLTTIGRALDALGPAAEEVAPLFITVDPERDRPEILAEYLRHFHPALIGLTGTPEQIAAAAEAYGIDYAKAPLPADESGGDAHGEPGHDHEDEAYLMDHAASIFLMDRNGRFVTAFPQSAGPQAIAAGLRQALGAGA